MLLAPRSRRAAPALVFLLLLATARMTHASASMLFQGVVQTLNTSNVSALSSPSGIVVDSSGNVYIADTGNSRIVEVSAQGAASALNISGLSPALSSPNGIAIDGAGNLYIADTGNNRIVEATSAGVGSVVSMGSITLTAPRGVAVDRSGNLFVADTGANRIVKVPSGGVAAAITVTGLTSPSTLNTPIGLGVDVSGNLYIADSVNNRIVKVAAGSTAGTAITIIDGVTLSTPSAVVADRIGNLYIADTAHNRIAEVDTSNNGGVVLSFGSLTLNAPLAVAVNPMGEVYIADTNNNRGLLVAQEVDPSISSGSPSYSLNKSVVGFGHIQLGSTTPTTLTLPFVVASPIGAVKLFTSGTRDLDFKLGETDTCTGAAFTACSVDVAFLPTAPGVRTGAIVLYDTSTPQNPVLTIPLYGYGDAPIAALNPNAATVVSTGTITATEPFQIALDGAGNMYVGNYYNAGYSISNVIKVPAGGGSASNVNVGSPGDSSLDGVTGIALDGAGDLFIADHQHARIVVTTPGGVSSVLTINGGVTLGYPTELAFDAAGNLFISDYTNGKVVEVTSLVVSGSTSSGYGRQLNLGTYVFSQGTLTGVAVGPDGTVYVADSAAVIKVTAAGAVSAVAPVGITFIAPQGVAVDGMGNVYIVDQGAGDIVKITTAGVASVIGISGLSNPTYLSPFGITVDPSGNLYIPDFSNSRILFVNVSGAAMSYANTNQGQTSNDSPKTATVTNLGNQPLIFSVGPTYTPDFTNNSSDANPCTPSTSLSAGAACDVAVNFTPQSAGSLSAGITVTDNTLNVASTTQQIAVSGTSINPGDTTSTTVAMNPTSLTLGQAGTLTATVRDTGTGHTSTVPTGSVTFIDTIGSTVTTLRSVNLSAGTAILTGAQLSGVGAHTITASYAGVDGTYLISSGSTTVAVTKAAATLGGTATQQIALSPGQAGSAALTMTSPYASLAAPSGTINYKILNATGSTVASGTLTLTAANSGSTVSIPIPNTLATGSYILSVIYSGDNNFQSSTGTPGSIVISQVTPTITLTSNANPAVATSAVVFTAKVSSTAGTPTGTVSFYDGKALLGTSTLSAGVATFTTSSLVMGSHSVTAVSSGDANFVAVTSSALAESILDFSLAPGTGSDSGSGTSSGTGSSGSSTSQTTIPGGTAVYPLAIVPNAGTIFPAPVTLTVSGVPAGATVKIAPSTWAQVNSSTWSFPANTPLSSVTMSIQLPQVSSVLLPSQNPARQVPPVLWGLLLLPFAGKMRRLSKRLGRTASLLFVLAVGLAAVAGLSGCGSTSGFFAQPTQTYTVTVTATSGALSHSTAVTLTVQ